MGSVVSRLIYFFKQQISLRLSVSPIEGAGLFTSYVTKSHSSFRLFHLLPSRRILDVSPFPLPPTARLPSNGGPSLYRPVISVIRPLICQRPEVSLSISGSRRVELLLGLHRHVIAISPFFKRTILDAPCSSPFFFSSRLALSRDSWLAFSRHVLPSFLRVLSFIGSRKE